MHSLYLSYTPPPSRHLWSIAFALRRSPARPLVQTADDATGPQPGLHIDTARTPTKADGDGGVAAGQDSSVKDAEFYRSGGSAGVVHGQLWWLWPRPWRAVPLSSCS